MVGEPIAVHLGMAVMELADLVLCPGRVDTEGDHGQQAIHENEAKQVAARAMIAKRRGARFVRCCGVSHGVSRAS